MPGETIPKQQSKEDGQIENLKIFFQDLGVDLEKTDKNILRKLTLLNKWTETIKDEENAVSLAQELCKFYEKEVPNRRFSKEEIMTVSLGTMFSDIGKTGPREATQEQEEVIVSIYSMEDPFDTSMTLEQFVSENFPDDFIKRLTLLEQIGVEREMTLRKFYNLHAEWTLGILVGSGVPQEAIAAAATHHMLEGVNPEGIVAKDSRFTRYFGTSLFFDRADKLVIILDKYDAYRRRGGKEHREAIESLRKYLASNEHFSNDSEFIELLDNLDNMVSSRIAKI